MDRRIAAEFCDGDHAASVSSHTSKDDISIEECERLVLSPPPVPMNLETACAAINAAARRSNSSRTHSIKTQPHDGHSDIQSQPSEQDLCKPRQEISLGFSHSHRCYTASRWRRLLCCLPDRSTGLQKCSKQNKAPYSADHHIEADNGDALLVLKPDAQQKTRNRKPKWFGSKSVPSDKPMTTNNVSNACTHKTDSPIILDRFPQKTIPSSSGFPETKSNLTGTVTCSTQHYRPTLPNYVLDSLVRSERPASSPIARPSNGRTAGGDESSENRIIDQGTQQQPPSTHQAPFKVHSTLTFTFPKLPITKRPTLEATQLSRDVTVQRDAPSQDSLAAESELVSDRHEDTHFRPYGGSFDNGDVEDCAVSSDMDHTDYQLGVEQNGGQGDSSSENLDTMTPGLDLLGEIPEDCINKKCLVLDLDETLVHSWFKYVENANFVVPVDLDGVKHQIYVCKRPHLDEFLRAVGPLFECVMFTASLRKYADPVCDYIDDGSCFRHRLFREACVYHQNNLIKDLSRLGRDVDQICIVDNSPVSFLFQPNNALQITSWFDDPNDQALLDLIPYLTALSKSDTVVDYLREFRPPSSAAVAQPTTPPWLLLFNPGVSDDQESGPDATLDEMGYDYSEEDAVLSPHFHPPTCHGTASAGLLRSYLAQVDREHQQRTQSQPPGSQLVHQHRIQLIAASLAPSAKPALTAPTASTTSSFIHQVTQPLDSSTTNSIGGLSSPLLELQDTKS